MLVCYNEWSKPEGAEEVNIYTPDWNDKDEELIKASGHGGSDYITARMFIECIKENKQPCHPFDIHSAVNMSSVAILSHRSVLERGTPYDIPDFHNEADLEKYENDKLTPFYGDGGEEPTIPCCSHPNFTPSEEEIERYKRILNSK